MKTTIDLNTCKPGQKLRSVHGQILTYVKKIQGYYPHEIEYPNGSRGTRLDNGQVYKNYRLPTDHDIVEILPL